jgi:hypothetical protein
VNAFDKLCAVGAFVLGLVFLVFGVLGLFVGCSARFTLPPLLGVLPAFVGWGIVRAVYFAWSSPPEAPSPSPFRERPTMPNELDYWQGGPHEPPSPFGER